ncbi:MAG: hypothetical protein KGH59_00440 [Candidatus Micrarchaeota archaeon]|nr:hypothetical protein [Candidatus Micrarchaeota archaeon]MDE1804241.1 hypothetical protein [Candidatus Micrarchaeota archaeon]MDE1846987.1 hypothetical protein [Candidatus Micrarchaeota archaeon]
MENQSESQLKRYNQLYLAVILRYKDYIEEKENLNVAELPRLITPTDESVISVANRIKGIFPAYSFRENYTEAVKFAQDYVNVEITNASLPIEFWLAPADTIKSGAGDVFDRANLLCSILISLGAVTAKVVTVVNSSGRRFLVYSESDQGIIAIDLEGGKRIFKDREQFLASLGLSEGDDVTAYEFNDKMYNNLA